MTLVVMAVWAVGTLLTTTIAIYVVAANVRRHEERVLSFLLSVDGSGRGTAQEVRRDDALLHNLPPPMVRLVSVGGIVVLFVTGLIYSRGERPDVAVGPRGVVITQPKSSDLPKEAEVHSTPVQSDRIPIPSVTAAPQIEEPDLKPTRIGSGYYFERLRVQGDGIEGGYVTMRHACVPPNMPEVCYLPQGQRVSRPVERE